MTKSNTEAAREYLAAQEAATKGDWQFYDGYQGELLITNKRAVQYSAIDATVYVDMKPSRPDLMGTAKVVANGSPGDMKLLALAHSSDIAHRLLAAEEVIERLEGLVTLYGGNGRETQVLIERAKAGQ